MSQACRSRLVTHYGAEVLPWLHDVPHRLDEAARAWGVRLSGFHDAGHASVLAAGRTGEGDEVLLKAWFDHDRFRCETAALRHWEPVNGPVLRLRDDQLAVACLNLVAGTVGGATRPHDADARVATKLAALHRHPPAAMPVLSLDTYLDTEVFPRVRRRATSTAEPVSLVSVDDLIQELRRPADSRSGLLHGDLYRENIAFDDRGDPVFLDPLPMLGDTAFDWAFFVVYHDLAADPILRLQLACRAGGTTVSTLRPWCLLLCMDGLLYYREVDDPRAARMRQVMSAIETTP